MSYLGSISLILKFLIVRKLRNSYHIVPNATISSSSWLPSILIARSIPRVETRFRLMKTTWRTTSTKVLSSLASHQLPPLSSLIENMIISYSFACTIGH